MTPAVRGASRVLAWLVIFGLELAGSIAVFVAGTSFFATHWGGAVPVEVRIAGIVQPHLEFACELTTAELQTLFARPDVIQDLAQLHAGITLSLSDLSAERAEVARRLTEAGIPVTAWVVLPKDQGYYLNSTNSAATAARFAEFQKWTSDYGLRWARIGLDIEPTLQEFGSGRTLLWSMLRRGFDLRGVTRAREAYASLIRQTQSAGYRVDTYQFPFIADERRVHSTLLERLFGIVDVRGDREVLMTYTSFNHAIDSALIWQYGPDAQLMAVGSTAGDPNVPRFVPLNWDEFTRDLIVAGHFSPIVGVYSLEGCIRQGFLARLKAMDCNHTVTIPVEANRKVLQLRTRLQAGLWALSRLPYFAAAIVLADLCFIWRRRAARRI